MTIKTDIPRYNLIKACVFAKTKHGRGIPWFMYGAPGTAKTSAAEQFASMWRSHFYCLAVGENGEGAFGVVPYPAKLKDVRPEQYARLMKAGKKHLAEQVVLTYPRPEWTMDFDEQDNGLVFVDELTTASEFLQAPLLGLILNKRVGGYHLPSNVRVGCAGNPAWMVKGTELSEALNNRLLWIKWEPVEFQKHADYMLGVPSKEAAKPLDMASEDKRVDALWDNEYMKVAGQEVAFLEKRPALRNKDLKEGEAIAGPWPSDRSWEMATRALTSARIQGLSADESEELVSGCIGTGAAAEWFGWMDGQDIPSPGPFLDGTFEAGPDGPIVHYVETVYTGQRRGKGKKEKKTWVHDHNRLDVTHALFAACISAVTKVRGKEQDRADLLWQCIGAMKRNKDICMTPAKSLTAAGLNDSDIADDAMANIIKVIENVRGR